MPRIAQESRGSARLWEIVDQRRASAVRLLQDLVSLSREGEDAKQLRVARELSRIGCSVEIIPYDPRTLSLAYEFAHPTMIVSGERHSVVGVLPGLPEARNILLFAHSDCESLSEAEPRSTPPVDPKVEGGRLHGWGVADDLAGVAAMVCALDAIEVAGLRPRGTIILASVPSKGNARGIIPVLNRGHLASGALYVHPPESGGGLGEIKAVTPGLLQFRIRLLGQSPPTSEPMQTPLSHLGINPIDLGWHVCGALRKLAERRAAEIHHAILEAAAGRSTNLLVSHIRGGNEGLPGLTDRACVLRGSITFPPNEPLEHAESDIVGTIAEAARQDPWMKSHPPEIEWLMGTNGAEVPLDHVLCETVGRAIADVTTREPKINPLHAASDIRHPILHSAIPAVGIGPQAGGFAQAGGRDEWVDVDDYIRTIKVVGTIVLNWCSLH